MTRQNLIRTLLTPLIFCLLSAPGQGGNAEELATGSSTRSTASFDYSKFQELGTDDRDGNKYSDQLIYDIYDQLMTDSATTANVGDWVKMKVTAAIGDETIEQVIVQEVVETDETAMTVRTVITYEDVEIVNSEEQIALDAMDNLDQLVDQAVAAGLIEEAGIGYESFQFSGKTFTIYRDSYEIKEETDDGTDTAVMTVWSCPQIPVFNLAKITLETTAALGTLEMTCTTEIIDFGFGT